MTQKAPPKRPEPSDLAEQALTAFSRLVRLTCTEEEAAPALRLHFELVQLYTGGHPGPTAERAIRRALALFGPLGIEERRIEAMAAVEHWARQWKRPEWQESEQTRALACRQLVVQLAELDDFEAGTVGDDWRANQSKILGLLDAVPWVAELLEAWDPSPRGKAGKRSAASIMAAIVERVGTAFELTTSSGTAAEIDRIRKRFESDAGGKAPTRDPA
jgi:hypothetical protein